MQGWLTLCVPRSEDTGFESFKCWYNTAIHIIISFTNHLLYCNKFFSCSQFPKWYLQKKMTLLPHSLGIGWYYPSGNPITFTTVRWFQTKLFNDCRSILQQNTIRVNPCLRSEQSLCQFSLFSNLWKFLLKKKIHVLKIC